MKKQKGVLFMKHRV